MISISDARPVPAPRPGTSPSARVAKAQATPVGDARLRPIDVPDILTRSDERVPEFITATLAGVTLSQRGRVARRAEADIARLRGIATALARYLRDRRAP